MLLTPRSADYISRCMQYLGRHYVRRFNDSYQHTGTLFEGRFKTSLVQSDRGQSCNSDPDPGYLLLCQRYIGLREGMVRNPADYTWSSFRAHAFGVAAGLWTTHPGYLALGDTPLRRRTAYRNLFAAELSTDLIADIRGLVNTSLVLGNDSF